jgi:hypothetical protein
MTLASATSLTLGIAAERLPESTARTGGDR